MVFKTSKIKEVLDTINLNLPPAPKPEGNYSVVNLRGDRLTVSIQFPFFQNQMLFQGRLGRELSTKEGYLAMQLWGLNVLAQIQSELGVHDSIALSHLHRYYQCVEDWDDAPKVADGASDLFSQVLGNAGKHTRSLSGAASLPRNFSVGLVTDFIHYPNY